MYKISQTAGGTKWLYAYDWWHGDSSEVYTDSASSNATASTTDLESAHWQNEVIETTVVHQECQDGAVSNVDIYCQYFDN